MAGGLLSSLLEEKLGKDAKVADAQARQARSGDRAGPTAAAAARAAASRKLGGSVGKGPSTVAAAAGPGPRVGGAPKSDAEQAAEARRAVGGRMGVKPRGAVATPAALSSSPKGSINRTLEANDAANARDRIAKGRHLTGNSVDRVTGPVQNFIGERNSRFMGNVRAALNRDPGSVGKSGKSSSNDTKVGSSAGASETAKKPTTTSDKPSGNSNSKPQANGTKDHAKAAAASTPHKPVKRKGSAGEASNRDLPGRTTIVHKPAAKPASITSIGSPRKIHPDGPVKRDVAALRARSKASGEEAKRAGAEHNRHRPGGGAESSLLASRGASRLMRLRNREK